MGSESPELSLARFTPALLGCNTPLTFLPQGLAQPAPWALGPTSPQDSPISSPLSAAKRPTQAEKTRGLKNIL